MKILWVTETTVVGKLIHVNKFGLHVSGVSEFLL